MVAYHELYAKKNIKKEYTNGVVSRDFNSRLYIYCGFWLIKWVKKKYINETFSVYIICYPYISFVLCHKAIVTIDSWNT